MLEYNYNWDTTIGSRNVYEKGVFSKYSLILEVFQYYLLKTTSIPFN
jgi:hypothetical protein